MAVAANVGVAKNSIMDILSLDLFQCPVVAVVVVAVVVVVVVTDLVAVVVVGLVIDVVQPCAAAAVAPPAHRLAACKCPLWKKDSEGRSSG